MLQGQLSYAIWLSLPADIRHKLVMLFNIPRSGSTIVDYRANGAVVTSDGYTAPDLQAITLAKMQGFLTSDSDNFYKLFEETVANLDALLGGTFVQPGPALQGATAPEERVPFCNTCDSKGGRHKKVCPKYA